MPLAAAYFPAVGVVVGACAALGFVLAEPWFGQNMAVLLALVLGALVTGAFHEDGLADTLDGFGGGWTLERKLEIMKDSRLGTYGALGLVFLVLFKFTALTAMPASAVPGALLLAHVTARWSILPLIQHNRYVSANGGSGTPLAEGVPRARRRGGLLITLLCAVVLMPFDALPGFVLTVGAVLLLGSYLCRRQIGGVTGDSLGAVNQLIEVAVYLVFVAAMPA